MANAELTRTEKFKLRQALCSGETSGNAKLCRSLVAKGLMMFPPGFPTWEPTEWNRVTRREKLLWLTVEGERVAEELTEAHRQLQKKL